MEAKFSPRVKEVIQYSREEAIRLGHDYIGCEHLLLGIIREGEGKAFQTLVILDVDALRLKKNIEDTIRGTASKTSNLGNIPLTKQAEKALKITYLEAKIFKTDLIGTEHLLLSILREDNSVASSILNKYGLIYDNVKDEYEAIKDDTSLPRAEFPGGQEEEGESFSSQRKSADPKSKTPDSCYSFSCLFWEFLIVECCDLIKFVRFL